MDEPGVGAGRPLHEGDKFPVVYTGVRVQYLELPVTGFFIDDTVADLFEDDLQLGQVDGAVVLRIFFRLIMPEYLIQSFRGNAFSIPYSVDGYDKK